MMKPKTILLWGENDLLTKAMEMFLTGRQMETWRVIRVPASTSIQGLAEQVQNLKPDLLILYQPNPRNCTDPLLKLLQDQPELRVIAERPELQIITVSLENNEIQVYSKRSITVQHVSDLLSVMEDRYFSENTGQKEVIQGE